MSNPSSAIRAIFPHAWSEGKQKAVLWKGHTMTEKHMQKLKSYTYGIWLASLMLGIASCNRFDDFMLGKDNTPVPKDLKPIASAVPVKKQWSVHVGKEQSKAVYLRLAPQIKGNDIYLSDGDGQLQAIHKNSGKVKWVNKTSYKFVSGPSVYSNELFMTTNAAEVVAFSPDNGKLLWHKKVSGDVYAPPVKRGNIVLVKTIDGNLYALDSSQGKQLWHLEHGAPDLVLKASSSPTMLDNHIALVGYSDGKLDTVDINTGHNLAQRNVVYPAGASDVERLVDIDADPIVTKNAVILADYQGFIGAISLTTGQILWHKSLSVYKNMRLDGNHILVTDSQDTLWSLDSTSGQVNWRQPQLRARNLTSPVVVGNKVFVADKTGLLHGIDKSTGSLISRTTLDGAVFVAPRVAGNHLYLLTAKGDLVCYTVGVS